MLISLAWRNLSRNRVRSILAGAAVVFAVFFTIWMRGVQDGSYAQMINQAVETRLGHLQVLPVGYLDEPDPELTVPGAVALVGSLEALEHVKAVAPRAIGEGMLSRDSEMARADLLGVDPEAEIRASRVPGKLLEGEAGQTWCRHELGRAIRIMGGDQRLFDRWCNAAGSSQYLPVDNDRAVVLGAGVARRLLVSVGDELTVQVVRALGTDEEGAEEGSLSQRRLEVSGVVLTGNPEIDDRVAFMHLGTLTTMMGTEQPNEIVVILDDIAYLESVRAEAENVAEPRPVTVHTWYQRNPQLKSLIDVDSQSGALMYFLLILVVAVGVVIATMMSVLERKKEFGVMLSLGMHRMKLFNLIMLEVGLLGVVAISFGALFGFAIEAFGRLHGYPIEWFGADVEAGTMSGVVYDPIYYAALRPEHGVMILVGVYLLFLLAGLVPAIIAARLKPVDAMRDN